MKNLLLWGAVLFLLGLLNGVAVPYFMNPRMGLSAHLAAVQSALVLLVFGLMWKHLKLSDMAIKLCSYSTIYGMYSIWVSLVLAASWGSSSATPIAGKGFAAEQSREIVVNILLYSGSVALILGAVLLIIGLVNNKSEF